jgi:hypothetical protein
MKKVNKIILSLVLILVSASSCRKEYLDVNTNPNFPADASIESLLPSAEAAIAHAVANPLGIYSAFYAQYWTQNPASSQYKTLEQYNPSADDFDRPWGIMYFNALTDLKTIIQKATAENKPQYVAIAKVLQAYAFQVLTDDFGDIPFSEALRGEEGILTPKYDKQEDVYNGIFAMLNDAISTMDENFVIDEAASADIFYGGDMFLWKKFANTLMLRASMRVCLVNPALAKRNIDSLTAHGALFIESGEDALINYYNEGGRSNPVYSSMIDLSFIQNPVASATTINYMLNNNDDRVTAFYSPIGGAYVGIAQGDYNLPPGTAVSLPSPTVGADANDDASASAPVKLITAYESYFLQAEAIARTLMAGDAQAMYEAGVTESFMSYGFADTTAQTYLSQPAIAYPAGGTMEDQVKAIITQKWAAMCGNQNNEAWAEARRTNYPDFFTVSVNSLIGNRLPARFPYPSTEVTRNASNFPGQKFIWEHVWWDVN